MNMNLDSLTINELQAQKRQCQHLLTTGSIDALERDEHTRLLAAINAKLNPPLNTLEQAPLNLDNNVQTMNEYFTCRVCDCTVPADYEGLTPEHCYLCDPAISLSDLLDDQD